MLTRVPAGLVPVLLLLAAAACGSPAQPEGGAAGGSTPKAAPETAAPPSELGESTISGVVKFEGKAPEARVIRMSSDPLCMPEGPTVSEVILVGPGNGLQNVFVYVKDGLGDRTFAVPSTPVVLDQRGCKYVPHVFGVQVGQPVSIVNSDGTLHNVHAVPTVNAEFNFGQPAGVPEGRRIFDQPEVMVPFRCDVHGWMAAYAGVVPHPFFAVSAQNGRYEIKGLPAGTYTIEAWHERFGVQSRTVTVDGKGAATAAFAFKAST